MAFLLSTLAAIAFTLGGVFMKAADGIRQPGPTAGFLLLFAVGAVLQSQAMRGAELGMTYILVLGLEALLAFSFGVALYGEPVRLTKIVAVLLVVAGIALLRTT